MLSALILFLWDKLETNKKAGQFLYYILWQLLIITLLILISGSYK